MPYPRKRFAQYWLKDAKVHQAIVTAAGLTAIPADPERGTPPLRDPAEKSGGGEPNRPPQAELPTILEIGPGTGQLTKRLLQTGARVIAVEIDRDLCRILDKAMGSHPLFQLIEGDFLELPIPLEATRVVANIPYNITGPILTRLLGAPHAPITHFDRLVLLVQKEVADRLSAKPGSKAYGAFSVRMQYLADCKLVRLVSPQSFKPSPKVMSAVIALHPRPCPTPAQDPRWFSRLVQQGFATRRKMLTNALQPLLDKEQVVQGLQEIGREPTLRAEQLSVSDWVAFSDVLLPYANPLTDMPEEPSSPDDSEDPEDLDSNP